MLILRPMTATATTTATAPFALLAVVVVSALLSGCESREEMCNAEIGDLYAQRIAPLLAEDRPKTCNQCHLAGVDLGLFQRDTPCETMACLVELDLVDLESPDDSRVLQWIGRARPDSALITQQVIDEEREGFREWIEHFAACDGAACVGVTCGPARNVGGCEVEQRSDMPVATADPADCSPIAREQAFLDRVYAWRGRCFPCHYDNSEFSDPLAPHWISGGGECGPASLTTMDNVLDLDVVDFANPEASLLLLKPLAEDQGGVMHGGHDKFVDTEDPTYQDFLAWIRYEASCRTMSTP